MSKEDQIREISDGLLKLFVDKDKRLSVVACLSIAATTARMIGMEKLELQQILIRCFDKRIAEEKARSVAQ